MPELALVLYDGGCGTCTASAARGQRLQRPGALQWLDNGSTEAQAMLRERGLLGRERDSLIVLDGTAAYLDSDAVVRAARGLRWPWRVLASIRLIPKPWRDAGYRRVAVRRARHEACQVAIRDDAR